MVVNNNFPTNHPCKSSCALQRQQILGHFHKKLFHIGKGFALVAVVDVPVVAL